MIIPRLLVLALASATTASGADTADSAGPAPRTMLVLDASGSMWGRIDGRPKIEIARAAVDAMLAGWRGGELGLMAYGHNRKGDCDDIELLQPVGPLDVERLRTQVGALDPRGMTPITAAVRQAAETLRHTERKATVILVSDGEETCAADPCALGAELEATGIDFTAHVVGFDVVAGSEAHRQLQCLASGTGGRYVEARDAGGLDAALAQVATRAPALTDAQAWIPGHSLTWVAGTVVDGAEDGDGTRSLDFGVDQTARDCRTMCEGDAACAGWHYEPTGSYFIDHPRCFLKGRGAPLTLEVQEEGWVAGVKPGVRIIAAGEPADEDAAD